MLAPLAGRITAAARFIGGLRGWRRNLTAFLFGICATLTLAPFFIFLFIIPAFTGLFWLINAAPTRRRIFFDGWWWGWGFYISGLYWFCIALLTDAEKFAWLLPFALFGLTAVIAVYCGIACWLMSWIRARGCTRIFIFSVIWMGVEIARAHWFSGFPWNLAGYAFGFSDATLQLASLVGIYGLTWLAMLLGASFAALPEKRGVAFVVVVWGVFFLGIDWGAWRLHGAPQEFVPNVMLRLVQANIAQPHKWDPKLQVQGMREHLRLTNAPGLDKITHIIWPETAIPYVVKAGTPLLSAIGNSLPPGKLLITGSLRAEDEDIWNSLIAVTPEGRIAGSYDKAKLVPFGEFQPLRAFVPKSWMTPVGDRDFSRGPGAQTLSWPGLPPLSPLICYEVIFPDLVVAPGTRPELLLNVTNDAWFGMSSGPHQHFEMARMRAVEQGLPLVRVANTGITAVIDGYGRIVASLPLGMQGLLDSRLPKAENLYTIYNKTPNIFLALLIFAAVLLTVAQRKRQNN